MSLTMYRASIPVFIRGLEVCADLLNKGAAFADEKGLAHADVINARLAPAMLPLAAQIQRASDTAKLSAARLSGVEAPRFEDSFASLQARIEKTIAFLKSIDQGALADSDTRTVTLKFPDFSPSFSGVDYLLGFGLLNFYFHVVTTHDILRHLGAPIGNRDYLGPLK